MSKDPNQSGVGGPAVRDQDDEVARLLSELADYRLLADKAADLVVKMDRRGRLMFVSPSYCALFGRDRDTLLGKTFMPTVYEADRPATALAMERLFDVPYKCHIEQRVETVVGWRWLAWSYEGLMDEHGEIGAIVGVGRDISALKQAEVALHESEQRYRQLFENMGSGVAVYRVVDGGEDFVFLELNRAAEKMLHVERAALIGKRASEMFPGIQQMGLPAVFKRVWSSGDTEYHPTRLYSDRRLALWVDNIVFKLPNDEIVAIFDDLSAQKIAEQRLRDSERRLRESQAYAQVGYWELLADRRKAYWSDEIYAITGLDPNVTTAGPDMLKSIVHPDDLPEVLQSLDHSFESGEEHRMEYRLRRPDGEERWVECRARLGGGDEESEKKLSGFLQDITERKQAELALKQSEERFELAMLGANEGLFDWDLENAELYLSPRWKSMLGYADHELSNTLSTWHELIESSRRDEVLALLRAYASGRRESFEVEYRMHHKHGHWVDVLARAYVLRDASNRPLRMVGTHVDISARKQAEQEIQHLAFHDSLTGLPNRLLFNQTLEQTLVGFRRSGECFAVHLFDLDHFKEINDSLGHPVGDDLLCAVADRIARMVRANDLLARLGGDEFALLQLTIASPEEAAVLANKIIDAVAEAFQLGDHVIETSVSVGIMMPQSSDVDATRLMSQADVAMYKAKEAGRGTYAFFEDAMTEQLRREMQLIDQLRDALREQQFFLRYQPQYDLGSGRLIGLEALLYWRHPTRGVLAPDDYQMVAERRGLLRQLSDYALEESIRQLADWTERGVMRGHMAINVTASQLQASNFAEAIAAVVDAHGLAPSGIMFEFAEHALIEASPRVRDALADLTQKGFRFAVDDFTLGFASFSFLRDCSADRLKIGTRFIADIARKPDDAAIVEAVLTLARAFGITTIAQGVDVSEQATVLRTHGCDWVQGALYGEPMGVDDAEALLMANVAATPPDSV